MAKTHQAVCYDRGSRNEESHLTDCRQTESVIQLFLRRQNNVTASKMSHSPEHMVSMVLKLGSDFQRLSDGGEKQKC